MEGLNSGRINCNIIRKDEKKCNYRMKVRLPYCVDIIVDLFAY